MSHILTYKHREKKTQISSNYYFIPTCLCSLKWLWLWKLNKLNNIKICQFSIIFVWKVDESFDKIILAILFGLWKYFLWNLMYNHSQTIVHYIYFFIFFFFLFQQNLKLTHFTSEYNLPFAKRTVNVDHINICFFKS